MTTFSRQTFADLYDEDSGETYEDLEFVRCKFRSCALSMARTPDTRTTVRRVTLRDCESSWCFVMSPILEEVTIDGLKSGSNPLFTQGALFHRTTLTGKFDSVVISPRADPVTYPDANGSLFDEAREEFYSRIDWALDIRHVEARSLEIYDVPASLVRRDPETQAVVLRESAAREDVWRALDLGETWWPQVLETMLAQNYDQAILVTPLRDRHAAAFIDGIRKLRAAGVAEPT
ncbi:hypothetical protein [Amycolatopsis sp. CB00013]|uniref:hypothetical protein n=1 Tax=Amycolatopsis sp. CB00013 TaxID=1703945 RepID=UPI00093C17DB|nr:hypothetical protein [Amycolatopsis sp. CB00013]OKK00191.1 hypothetical protein AMK34_00560 [Amycolatopsis sp. CB00013]